MELDFSDVGDAWMLDAMDASLLLFPAMSPPLPWPCGDNEQHPSTPPDMVNLADEDPGAPTSEVFSDLAIDFAVLQIVRFARGSCDCDRNLMFS
jgi:hypothetical protein